MSRARDLLSVLAADPERLGDVRPEEVPDLLAELEGLKARLYLRIHAAPSPAPKTPREARGPDELLNVNDAADLLGVDTRWLYRKADSLPFTRRLGPRTLRFSRNGIERWLDTRKN